MNLIFFKLYPSIVKIGLVLFLLVGCDSENLNLAEGGLEGTGIGGSTSIGSISDFGSIVVNDITYDTSRAEVFVNGEAASFEQLRLGMQVMVDSIQVDGREVNAGDGGQYPSRWT